MVYSVHMVLFKDVMESSVVSCCAMKLQPSIDQLISADYYYVSLTYYY